MDRLGGIAVVIVVCTVMLAIPLAAALILDALGWMAW